MNQDASAPPDWLRRFFGVVAEPRSYSGLLYLLLAFPLGLFYFIFLVVGLTLGAGLILLWIGFLVLATVLVVSWPLTLLERQQAIWLLGADLGPAEPPAPQEPGAWSWIRRWLGHSIVWKGLAFLFVKFPLGLVSFVATIVGLSVSFAMLAAPLLYRWDPIWFFDWRVDTLPEALLLALLGVPVLLLTLHLLNGLSWLWRQLASWLLAPSPSSGPALGRSQPAEA